jgi:hypothetical protein
MLAVRSRCPIATTPPGGGTNRGRHLWVRSQRFGIPALLPNRDLFGAATRCPEENRTRRGDVPSRSYGKGTSAHRSDPNPFAQRRGGRRSSGRRRRRPAETFKPCPGLQAERRNPAPVGEVNHHLTICGNGDEADSTGEPRNSFALWPPVRRAPGI